MLKLTTLCAFPSCLWQSKEVGVQLQEDLMKVLNELYTVRQTADGSFASLFPPASNQQREDEASDSAPLGCRLGTAASAAVRPHGS